MILKNVIFNNFLDKKNKFVFVIKLIFDDNSEENTYIKYNDCEPNIFYAIKVFEKRKLNVAFNIFKYLCITENNYFIKIQWMLEDPFFDSCRKEIEKYLLLV